MIRKFYRDRIVKPSCACPFQSDARECYDARYPLPLMDSEREAERQNRIQDREECECPCHEDDPDGDEIDGEVFRGRESAGFLQEQQAHWRGVK